MVMVQLFVHAYWSVYCSLRGHCLVEAPSTQCFGRLGLPSHLLTMAYRLKYSFRHGLNANIDNKYTINLAPDVQVALGVWHVIRHDSNCERRGGYEPDIPGQQEHCKPQPKQRAIQ